MGRGWNSSMLWRWSIYRGNYDEREKEIVNIKKYYQGSGKSESPLNSEWLWTDGNQYFYLVHFRIFTPGQKKLLNLLKNFIDNQLGNFDLVFSSCCQCQQDKERSLKLCFIELKQS